MLKEIKGFSRFYVNELGEVFAVKKNKFKGEVLRPLSICRGANGYKKVNMQDDSGKFTSKLLHSLVYEAFKGDNYSVLAFLDGDKGNCRLDNLMSLEELVTYYNTTSERKID